MKVTLQATNQCVMCGLCLPHCPTYRKTRNEAESPRGRVSLMRALYTDKLPVSDQLAQHLHSCLSCRACEAVCPANVPYGQLIDLTHHKLLQQGGTSRRIALRIASPLLAYRWLRNVVRYVFRAYQQTGLQKLVRATGVLKALRLQRAEALLPEISNCQIRYERDDNSSDRNTVALFTGCVAEIFDRDTLAASKRLLDRLGYNVVIPRRQTCCGAIHQHNGALQDALKYITRNIEAFHHESIDVFISTASGCGALLAEVGDHIPSENATRFSSRHRDISAFVAKQPWSEAVELKPLNARVAVHAA